MKTGTSTSPYRVSWTSERVASNLPIRTSVALGEFEELVARGLKSLLVIAGFDVISNGTQIEALPDADLVILNLGCLRPGDMSLIAALHPAIGFVVLAVRPTHRQTQTLLAQGATAVLSHLTPERELVAALRLAARGLWVADPYHDPVDTLSGAERPVHALLCAGLSNAAIADSLHLGTETIRTHARRVYSKLGVRGRHDLHVSPLERDPTV